MSIEMFQQDPVGAYRTAKDYTNLRQIQVPGEESNSESTLGDGAPNKDGGFIQTARDKFTQLRVAAGIGLTGFALTTLLGGSTPMRVHAEPAQRPAPTSRFGGVDNGNPTRMTFTQDVNEGGYQPYKKQHETGGNSSGAGGGGRMLQDDGEQRFRQ